MTNQKPERMAPGTTFRIVDDLYLGEWLRKGTEGTVIGYSTGYGQFLYRTQIGTKVYSMAPAEIEPRRDDHKKVNEEVGQMINGTKVVCLSGSTRFTAEMMMLTWEFAKKGIIALGWVVLPSNHLADGSEVDHHLAEKEGVEDILDELHLRKIDLADEVIVVNVGGYIGDGTRREIAYAEKTGKPVHYLKDRQGG